MRAVWISAAIAALGLTALLAAAMSGCYPKGPTPPSCAQDQTQPWCLPPVEPPDLAKMRDGGGQ